VLLLFFNPFPKNTNTIRVKNIKNKYPSVFLLYEPSMAEDLDHLLKIQKKACSIFALI